MKIVNKFSTHAILLTIICVCTCPLSYSGREHLPMKDSCLDSMKNSTSESIAHDCYRHLLKLTPGAAKALASKFKELSKTIEDKQHWANLEEAAEYSVHLVAGDPVTEEDKRKFRKKVEENSATLLKARRSPKGTKRVEPKEEERADAKQNAWGVNLRLTDPRVQETLKKKRAAGLVELKTSL